MKQIMEELNLEKEKTNYLNKKISEIIQKAIQEKNANKCYLIIKYFGDNTSAQKCIEEHVCTFLHIFALCALCVLLQ